MRDVNKRIFFLVTNSSKKIIPAINYVKEDRNENGIYIIVDRERNVFPPGETVRGKPTAENHGGKRINAANPPLVGLEYVVAISEEENRSCSLEEAKKR